MLKQALTLLMTPDFQMLQEVKVLHLILKQ